MKYTSTHPSTQASKAILPAEEKVEEYILYIRRHKASVFPSATDSDAKQHDSRLRV